MTLPIHSADKPCARCGVAERDISSYCYPCHRANGRESVARQGGTRRYHLKQRYGITPAEFDRLVEQCGGVCAICREREPTHLDHDHTTNRVRGLLCVSCNNGIGLFKDNPKWLREAAEYLEGGE